MSQRDDRPSSGLRRRHRARGHGTLLGFCLWLFVASVTYGAVRVTVEHHLPAEATADFLFQQVPRPAATDAATEATFTLVAGRGGGAGGDSLARLHDGRLPQDEDDPGANFFLADGTDGGRLLVDLGRAIKVREVNSYSWHPNTRAPQVYQLYASAGTGAEFNPRPARGTDPTTCGWTLLARVDTRPATGEVGGQYGVSLTEPEGNLGRFRYLLFDLGRTEAADPFGNTFYSEIDVIDAEAPPAGPPPPPPPGRTILQVEGGRYQITLDTVQAPALRQWAEHELAPVVVEWYPRLVELLPSVGFQAPRRLSIVFSDRMRGVAATSGTRIRCAASWFEQNLTGEAKGAVVHELVHVVQQYGRARALHPQAARAPGWLVEGIADYLRWFKYEPQSHGADISPRGLARARYDGNYRITANFLNWVSETYDPFIAGQLNAAARDGADALAARRSASGLADRLVRPA